MSKSAQLPESVAAQESTSEVGSEEELSLTKPVPQLVRVGEDITVNVAANTTLVVTPAKKYKGSKRVDWTDDMKTQVLRLYINLAEDPLCKNDPMNPQGKAIFKKQIPEHGPIYNGVITYQGEKTLLSSLCKPDTLHQHFACKGLSKQEMGKGLANIIYTAMEGKEQTRAKVIEMEGDIMDLAAQFSK